MSYNPYLQAQQGLYPQPSQQIQSGQLTPEQLQAQLQANQQIVQQVYTQPALQRSNEVTEMAEELGTSVGSQLAQANQAWNNPYTQSSQERLRTRAQDAKQRNAARLGDEEARRANIEDGMKIATGSNPDQVRKEREDYNKFKEQASDQQRIENYEVFKQNQSLAHQDFELMRDIMFASPEDVKAKYQSRPELLNYILGQKEQRMTNALQATAYNNTSSDSVLNGWNALGATVAGVGENVGGYTDLYNLATLEGQDRIDALNNGVSSHLAQVGDDLQNAGAKASDTRAKAREQYEQDAGLQAYAKAIQAGESKDIAENRAEFARTGESISSLINNPYQITKEVAQFVPDMVVSLLAGGGITRGFTAVGKKALEKSIKHFDDTLANKVKQEAIQEAIAKGQKEGLEEIGNKAVKEAKAEFTAKAQQEISKQIERNSKLGIAGFESVNNALQNAPQGYQTTSQNIMSMPLDKLKETQGFKDIKAENPNLSDKAIQAKMADAAGLKGYAYAGLVSAGAGALGSNVEANIVLGRAKGLGKKLTGSAINAAEEAVEEGGSVVAGNVATNQETKDKTVSNVQNAGKSAVMGALASGTTTAAVSVPAGLKSGIKLGQNTVSKIKEKKALKTAGEDLDNAFNGSETNVQESVQPETKQDNKSETKPESKPNTYSYGNEALNNINTKAGTSYATFGDMIKDLNKDYQSAIASKNLDSEETKAFNSKRTKVKEELDNTIAKIKSDKQNVDNDLLSLVELSNNDSLTDEQLDKETNKLLTQLKKNHPEIANTLNPDDSQDTQTIAMFNALNKKAQHLFAQSQGIEDTINSKLKFIENDLGKSNVKANTNTQDVDINNLQAKQKITNKIQVDRNASDSDKESEINTFELLTSKGMPADVYQQDSQSVHKWIAEHVDGFGYDKESKRGFVGFSDKDGIRSVQGFAFPANAVMRTDSNFTATLIPQPNSDFGRTGKYQQSMNDEPLNKKYNLNANTSYEKLSEIFSKARHKATYTNAPRLQASFLYSLPIQVLEKLANEFDQTHANGVQYGSQEQYSPFAGVLHHKQQLLKQSGQQAVDTWIERAKSEETSAEKAFKALTSKITKSSENNPSNTSLLSKVKRIKVKIKDTSGQLTLDLDGKEVKVTKQELEDALAQRIKDIDTNLSIPFGKEKSILSKLLNQTKEFNELIKDSGFEPSDTTKAILNAMQNIESALGNQFEDINNQEARVLIEQFFGANRAKKKGKILGLVSYLQHALKNGKSLPHEYRRYLDNFLHSQAGKVIGLTSLVKEMKQLKASNPSEFTRIAKSTGFTYDNPYVKSGKGMNLDDDITTFHSLDKAVNHLNRTKRVYDNFQSLGRFILAGESISLVQDKGFEPTKEMKQAEKEVSNLDRNTRSKQDVKQQKVNENSTATQDTEDTNKSSEPESTSVTDTQEVKDTDEVIENEEPDVVEDKDEDYNQDINIDSLQDSVESLHVTHENNIVENVNSFLKSNNITLEDSNKFNDILSNLPQGTLDNIIKRLEKAMTNLHNNYAVGLIQFNHDVNTKWDSKKAYTNSKAQLERLNATSADLKNVKKYGVELLEAIEKQPETDAQYVYQQLATAMFDILQTRISESPYEDLVNTSGKYPAVTPAFRILKSNIMSDFNKVFGNNSTKIYSSNESLSDIANASNESLLTYIYNQIQQPKVKEYIETQSKNKDTSANEPYKFDIGGKEYSIPMWFANELTMRGISLVENPLKGKQFKSRQGVIKTHYRALLNANKFGDIKAILKDLNVEPTKENITYLSNISKTLKDVKGHLTKVVPTLVRTKGLTNSLGVSGLLNFMSINDVSNANNIVVPDELVQAMTAGIIYGIQQSKNLSSGSSRTTEDFLLNNEYDIIAEDITRGTKNAKEIPLQVENLGSNKNAYVASIGKFMMDYIGLNPNDNTNLMQGIAGSLGLEVLNHLYNKGLIKQTRVTHKDSFGRTINHFDFVQGAWNMPFVKDSASVQLYTDLASQSNNELTEQLFGITQQELTNQDVYVKGKGTHHKAQNKDADSEFTTGNNKTVKDFLEIFDNQEWKLNEPYLDLQDNLGELFDYATEKADLDEEMTDYSRAAKESKANQLQRNKEKLQSVIEQGLALQADNPISDNEKRSNIRVKGFYELTSNGRLMQKSQLNMQNQKYHRESMVLVQKDKDGNEITQPLFKVSPDILANGLGAYALNSEDNNVKLFALAIAQALGVKIEKNSFAKISKQLDEALVKPVNADMFNLIKQGLKGNVPMNQDNKNIAKAFANEYGTGSYRAIHALMSLGQLEQAKDGSDFYSDLFIEADGIGNGMHNISLQFSTGFSDSLFKTLTKTGVILTSKIAEAYEKSQANGETKSLYEIVDSLEGSAEIFSNDLNQEVPKDVYEDVSDTMAKDIQQSFIDIATGLDYLGTVSDVELPNSIEDYVLNNTKNIVEQEREKLVNQLEETKDKEKQKDIRSTLSKLNKLNQAVNAVIVLTVSGSMKGLTQDALDLGKTIKADGQSLIKTKFSDVLQTKKGQFVSNLVSEISRSLAKAGVTPSTYGGKLDGITSQLIQNFQKDVTALADKAIANKDKELYKQAVLAMVATDGITYEQSKEALENFDKGLLNKFVTQFNKARSNVANQIKTSAASLLNKAVDSIYGEALSTATKFIALSSPLFSVFEQEFMDKVRNQLDKRNLDKGWARKEDGKVIIIHPNGYNPLTKKEFKEIFKTTQSLPVVATAYSNNDQLLDELIHTGNSNVKTKVDSKVYGSLTSAYQNTVLLGHIQASIQTQNKLFMEAGASTFTNTVVSTESRSQAETQKALSDMGFSTLNVYDGNDAVVWLAGLVGELINQNSWNVHQNYSVMEALFNMYNNSTLFEMGKINTLESNDLKHLRDIINNKNKLKTSFGLPVEGNQVPFTEKWAQQLVKPRTDNSYHPITKESIVIDANLLTQLKLMKAAMQITRDNEGNYPSVLHTATQKDESDLFEIDSFINQFEDTINSYRMAQGYPEQIKLPLSDSKVLYMASVLPSIHDFDTAIAHSISMNQLGRLIAKRYATMAVLNELPIKYNQYAGANRGVLLNAEDEAETLRIIKIMVDNSSITSDKDLVEHLVLNDPKFEQLYNKTYAKHAKRLTLNSSANLNYLNNNVGGNEVKSVKTVADLIDNLNSDMYIGIYEYAESPMEIKNTLGKVLDVLKPVFKSLISEEDNKLPVFLNKKDAETAYAEYLSNGGTGVTLQEFSKQLDESTGLWIPNVGLYIEDVINNGVYDNSTIAHELLHVALGKIFTAYSNGTLDKERTEAVNHIVETALQMFDNLSADVSLQTALEQMIANEQNFEVNEAYQSMSAFKASLLNMKYVFGDVAQQSFTTEQLQNMQYTALQEFTAYMFTDTDALLRLHTRTAVKTSKTNAEKGITKLLQHLSTWFKQARNHVVKFFGLTNKDSQAKSQLISLLSDVYSLQGMRVNTEVNPSVLSKSKLKLDIGDVKASNVQNMSAEDVITNMVNTQNNSAEHKAFLTNLLTYANENIDKVLQKGKVGNLTIYNFPDEAKALESDELDNKAIDYINNLRSNGLNVNQAEENAFRLMYKAVSINFMGNTPRLKEQASELVSHILNGLEPNKFINGLQGYRSVFSGNKEEQIIQVLALAITNEDFKNHIGAIKPNSTKQSKVAKWFKDKLVNTVDNTFVGLDTIKDIEAVGLALAKFNFRDKLTVQAEIEQDIANQKANRRDREIIKSINKATKGNKITEFVGSLLANSFTGKDRINVKEGTVSNYEQSFVGDMIDGVVRYNAMDKGRPSSLSQFMQLLTGERKDTHHIADAHSRNLVNTDAVRNRVINMTKKGLRGLFKKSITAKQDKSINRMLRTSAYNLVLHPNYSIESLRHINDKQFIDDTVNTLQQSIKSMIDKNIQATPKVKEKIFNYLVWQSKGLADLQRDNEAKSANSGITNHIMPNAEAIASLAQIQDVLNFSINESFSKDLYSDLSALIAVQSLDGLNQQDKNDLIEFAKAEPKPLTNLAYNMRSTYRDKSNGFGLIGKDGHINNKRNPHYDIKLVNKSDISKQQELYDIGYRIKGYTSNGDIIYWTNVSLGNRFKTGMFGLTEHSQGGINVADNTVLGGYQTDVSLKAERDSVASFNTQLSKAMLDPNYYDSLNSKSSYNVVISQDGETIAYNNEVPYQLVEQLIPNSEAGIDSLAHKVGRIIEEQLISAQNKNYVDLLNSKYNQDLAKQNYIRIDGVYSVKGKSNLAKHTQEKINNFYKMLPEATRQYIEEQGGLYIPVTELDNIIGYHEMWISDVFTGKSFLPEPVQIALRGVFNLFGKITNTNPAKIARYTEEILREGTSLSKDYILNRSLIVPAANMISNVMHLVQWGINPLEIPKLMYEGYSLAKQYQKRLNELDSLSFQLKQPNLSESQRAKLEAKRANLQNIVNSSEVNPLVKAGILTSVTTLELGDDVSDTDFSRFNQIRDKIGLNKMIDKTPELAKSLLIQNGSKSHKLLTEMLDYGDFVAKYALYKHLTKKKGKSAHQSLNVIREEFINYSRNKGAMFDWLNSVGLAWFLNYKLGIQKIIYRSFRRNFLRTAAIMSSDTVLKDYDPLDIYQTVPNQFISVGNVLPFGSYQTTPHLIDGFESHYLVKLLGLLH